MCLIIFTPNAKTVTLRKAVLERAFERHSDGAGFAYVKGGRIIVSKGHMTFSPLWEALESAREGLTGPLLIHFRWGTCGPDNAANTQPATIHQDRLVMAHNGMFHGLRDQAVKAGTSDSVALARLLRRTGWRYPFSKAHVDLLGLICGGSSKLVFLDHKANYLIVNESMGKWVMGAWYSDNGRIFKRDACELFPVEDDEPDLDDLGDDFYDRYEKTVRGVRAAMEARQTKVFKPASILGPNNPSLGALNTQQRIQLELDVLKAKRLANPAKWEGYDPDLMSESEWLRYKDLTS